MRIFSHGNTAALVVGIVLMIADTFIPFAKEFGAWPIGCLFAVLYSASAVRDNAKIKEKAKRWSYVYLVIVFLLFVTFRDSLEAPIQRAEGSIHPALKSLGFDKR